MILYDRIDVKRQGCGFTAVDTVTGERLIGLTSTRELAEIQAFRALKKILREPRKCLTCRRVFLSEGAWNRMCNQCRKSPPEG